MLVWGLGNETAFWYTATKGNVTFIDDRRARDDKNWFHNLTKVHPYLEVFQVNYATQLSTSLKQYHGHSELWNEKLVIHDFPEQLWKRHWDVILVDGPSGRSDKSPGRYQSLYTSFRLAENQITREGGGTVNIVVDNYERRVERDFSREVFGREPVDVITRKEISNHSDIHQQAQFIFGDDAAIVKPNLTELGNSATSSSGQV